MESLVSSLILSLFILKGTFIEKEFFSKGFIYTTRLELSSFPQYPLVSSVINTFQNSMNHLKCCFHDRPKIVSQLMEQKSTITCVNILKNVVSTRKNLIRMGIQITSEYHLELLAHDSHDSSESSDFRLN